MSQFESEIKRRRTFAIISHPDAGKTTLTEKFLLYGGAIAQAGQVKGKKNTRAAVSDWMEIEKQRGISVTSSVLQFQYGGFCINILDTPGHQDFSEDTYRTLMAADSAVMVIDGAKGVEAQTRKLFKVCVMRDIPIFTFINKMDREARDPFALCEEIEKELGIDTYPVNWPIGSGKDFLGVYDRNKQEILHFSSNTNAKKSGTTQIDRSGTALKKSFVIYFVLSSPPCLMWPLSGACTIWRGCPWWWPTQWAWWPGFSSAMCSRPGRCLRPGMTRPPSPSFLPPS